jgi:hypothetical protein
MFRFMIRSLIIALAYAVVPSHAGTIISVTGSNQINWSLNDVQGPYVQTLGAGWSTAQAYNNVTVTAELGLGDAVAPLTIEAFLTRTIGAGTTVADEVASTILSASPATFAPTPITIFTGLELTAGTYFLTIAAIGQDGIWFGDESPLITATPGTTLLGRYREKSQPMVGYIPANMIQLGTTEGPQQMRFAVTEDSAVPEPTTLVLVGGACWALVALRRKAPA